MTAVSTRTSSSFTPTPSTNGRPGRARTATKEEPWHPQALSRYLLELPLWGDVQLQKLVYYSQA